MTDLIAFLNARLDDAGAEARAALIAGSHPARPLREIAAMRRIVAWHAAECTCTWVDEHGDDLPEPDTSGYGCPTMLMLAAIWGDRPDYRQEWKL